MALQVPQQVSGNGTGGDKTTERGVEETFDKRNGGTIRDAPPAGTHPHWYDQRICDATLRPQELILTGTTNESVTLQISHLLFIEAVGNYVKVNYLRNDQVHTDMLRATMKQMVEALNDYPMIVRCHRAFLVNLGQVEQIVSHSGSTQLLIKHCNESLPVSRSNMSQVKAAIKRGQSDAHIDSALA